jgi:hypothetical protein
VAFGRSAGSTKAGFEFILRNLVYPQSDGSAPAALVDSLVLTSHSNPFTLDAQITNVYEQAAAGLFEMVPESLDSFQKMAAEERKLLETLAAQHPELLESPYFDRVLFLQGVSDEDGGPRVIEDHHDFTSRYMKTSHTLIFQNPLLNRERYPQLVQADGKINYTKISPDVMEATHFLLSTRDDFTMADWNRHFPDVEIRAEDLPRLKTQALTTLAATYLHLDYLVDQSPFRDLPEFKESNDRIKRNRDKLAGPGKTFLKALLSQRMYKDRVKAEDLSQAKASMTGTLAERIKYLLEFFERRAVEQEAYLP